MRINDAVAEAKVFVAGALGCKNDEVIITETHSRAHLMLLMGGYISSPEQVASPKTGWFTLVIDAEREETEIIDFRGGLSEDEIAEFLNRVRTKDRIEKEHKESGRNTA